MTMLPADPMARVSLEATEPKAPQGDPTGVSTGGASEVLKGQGQVESEPSRPAETDIAAKLRSGTAPTLAEVQQLFSRYFEQARRDRQAYRDYMKDADVSDADRNQRLLEDMQEHNGQVFALQLLMQRASRRVELLSKVVEHASSGTKTVLQTQTG